MKTYALDAEAQAKRNRKVVVAHFIKENVDVRIKSMKETSIKLNKSMTFVRNLIKSGEEYEGVIFRLEDKK